MTTTSAELPPDVREATEHHLTALDAAAPGLVTSLYLTGSVALGDYHPGRSDIDFVAFTSRPVTGPDVTQLLARVHAGLRGSADYDGNYVEAACLPAVPDDERVAPHVVGGQFRAGEPNHQLTPATWGEFARYAIAVRGPERAELGISVSPARLTEWTLGNLNGYWTRCADAALAAARGRDPAAGVSPGAVTWLTLGAARLHYTLATGGDFASKCAAGDYAADLFPQYRELAAAARSWRATGRGNFTGRDGVACGELTLAIVADANQRWG